MTKEVYWSDESKKDVNEIIEFIQYQWNQQIVSDFLDKIDHSIFQISKNPKTFPLINREFGIRKCVISKHNSIFYTEEDKKVYILRVFANRKDPEKLKF
ncbi:MAG: type II toxin-antitoxin system RelE/ParE family toxin [Spirosomataceae bacterium]|jgi:plasmid stabilization system protein ParE